MLTALVLLTSCLGMVSGSLHKNPTALDAGMFYAALQSTSEEWRSSFGTTEHGSVHIWLKCVETQLRSFFFVDSTSYLQHALIREQPSWVATQPPNINKAQLFVVNGSAPRMNLSWPAGVGGGAFFVTLNESNTQLTVPISVLGWSSWVDFPLRYCVKSMHHRPKGLSIVTTAFSHELSLSNEVVDSILLNARYHRCALNIHAYEIIVSEAISATLLTRIENMSYVRLLTPPSSPNNFNFGVESSQTYSRSCVVCPAYWQAVYYNLAILRHWEAKDSAAALAMWDPDEFLVNFDNSYLYDSINAAEVLSVERQHVLCTNCMEEEAEIRHFSQNSWARYFRGAGPKVIVRPEFVHAMYVHNALPFHEVTSFNETRGFLVHFFNMAVGRVKHAERDRPGTLSQVPFTLNDSCWQEALRPN